MLGDVGGKRLSMNSADVRKSKNSDPGMEVGKPYIAPGFQSLTSGGGKELLLCDANLGDPKYSPGSIPSMLQEEQNS